MRAVRQTTIVFICAAIISPGGVAALFARRCWVLGSFVASGRAGPGDPRLEIGKFQECGAANRDGTLKLRPPAWRGSQRPAGVSRTSLPGEIGRASCRE